MAIVLADDLTGAADCATVLGVHSQNASLCLDVNALNEASDAYSVNLGTRSCEAPQTVYDVTKKALEGLLQHEALPYFKVDSTWRSDAVAIALAGMDTLKAPFVLLCPAFPQEGRTIIESIAYLHGVPLHETSLKNDPQDPIKRSDVQALMQTQARALSRSIHILSGSNISVKEIEDALSQDPKTPLFVVPDVESTTDLKTLAELVASLKQAPLCMGSAGLLDALVAQTLSPFGESCFPHPNLLPKGEGTGEIGKIQVISGSLNPTTIEQIQRLQEEHPELKVLNTASWGKVLDWSKRLKQSVVTLQEEPSLVTILCGGSTAEAVLAQAGVKQLHWVKALSRTCSLWQAVEDRKDSRYWVLKSGNMGEADLLLQLVKELSHAFQIPPTKHL
ncbi:MAG: four-carbon acid sugar kinase family protein [Vampirovibrionales bacterium]